MSSSGSDRGTAVVTGAGQGIGRAIAVRLAADGFDVLGLDVNGDQLASLSTVPGCRTAVVDVAFWMTKVSVPPDPRWSSSPGYDADAVAVPAPVLSA